MWSLATYRRGHTIGLAALREDGILVGPPELKQWATMLDLCPSEHHPVLVLRREGLPMAEIAARTGLHEGSVRRILRRLARELALKAEPLGAEADAET